MPTHLHPTPKVGVIFSNKSLRSPNRARIRFVSASLAAACSGESNSACKVSFSVHSLTREAAGKTYRFEPTIQVVLHGLAVCKVRFRTVVPFLFGRVGICWHVRTWDALDCHVCYEVECHLHSKFAPFAPANSWPRVVEIQVGLRINVVRCFTTVIVRSILELATYHIETHLAAMLLQAGFRTIHFQSLRLSCP
jgi:hypothetical protein